MYFIELILKKFAKKQDKDDFITANESQNKDYEACEHVFMPIDSTGETLSCLECGLVVKKCEMEKKNIFKR